MIESMSPRVRYNGFIPCSNLACRECANIRVDVDEKHPHGGACFNVGCCVQPVHTSTVNEVNTVTVLPGIPPAWQPSTGWDYEVRYAREGQATQGIKLRGVSRFAVGEGFLTLRDDTGGLIFACPTSMSPVITRLRESGPEDAVPGDAR
jgi:hypothetical protein